MICKHDPRERTEIDGGYIDSEDRIHIHIKCGVCGEDWFEEWEGASEATKDFYRKLAAKRKKNQYTGETTYDFELKASLEITLPTGNIRIPEMKIVIPISYRNLEEAKMLEEIIKAALEKVGIKVKVNELSSLLSTWPKN